MIGHSVVLKVGRYISVVFSEMGPHKEAVHVGFGDDGEGIGLEVKPAELADFSIFA